jgi:hypothetical protein
MTSGRRTRYMTTDKKEIAGCALDWGPYYVLLSSYSIFTKYTLIKVHITIVLPNSRPTYMYTCSN